jgi:hypothetical protein
VPTEPNIGEKRTKLGQKGPKRSINRGGQLILTIANWKITKKKKNPLLQNANSRIYGGQKILKIEPSKYK